MKRRFVIPLLLTILLSPIANAQDETPEGRAKADALQWLALSDAGNYGATWEQASTLFQSRVSKEKWVGKMQKERMPLGDVKSRQFIDTAFSMNPPQAPAGEYSTVRFDTLFKQPTEFAEHFVMHKAPDGSWRVVGYGIGPR